MMWIFFLLYSVYVSNHNLGLASVESDYGTWNSLILVKKINHTQALSLEHEVRYSDELGNLDQEQLKFLYFYDLKVGRLAFGGNLRTENSYGVITEKRALIQWDNLLYSNKTFNYSSRVRYELRDFNTENSLVRRFRWLNRFGLKLESLNEWTPSLTSELNFYLNDTSVTNSGFYSHRTIVSVGKVFGSYGFSVKYVNDYKQEPFEETVDNVLGVDVTYFLN